MKKKELKTLKTKNKPELKEFIKKTEEELIRLGVDLAAGRVKNVCLLAQKRHNLAQVKTILKIKELDENS